ncbi:PIN domain-containing protein [Chlorobium sp. KB01]|uniref:type II toxin-antitoxin system VapC family toxin n=1 Tax=Chlorobium sp. KB01 TaxID=1917528 RepID=UPI0018EA3118|nr:PIN domain-containing protein [Chlorobium sp. KB01]
MKAYSFISSDQILIDTNIWLYLYPPPGNSSIPFAVNYSRAFASLVQNGAIPILDPMVLSEYLNRYCRIEWEAHFSKQYPKYKDFRNSSIFQPIAASAVTLAAGILRNSRLHSLPTNKLDLKQAISDFGTGQSDFNDAVLTDICRQQNLKLLTNDSDFQTGGIEVITSNPKLLKACP